MSTRTREEGKNKSDGNFFIVLEVFLVVDVKMKYLKSSMCIY